MTEPKRAPGGVVLAAALLAAVAGMWPAESCGDVDGSVGVGFDSFRERYSIVDADTLDSITELRSRLALGYTRGSLFDDYARLAGRAAVGDDAVDWSGHAAFIERLGAGYSRVGLDADISRRDYRDDSSYEYANDFTRAHARAYARWSVAPAVSVRLTNRIEHLDYARRTEFDYDYTRNTVSLDGELAWNITNVVAGGVGFTAMSIPDSTDIAYEAWSPVFELRIAPEPYRRFLAYADVERRLYAHEPSRSSFWSLYSTLAAEVPLRETLSLEATGRLERYAYDAPSDIYFDFTEARGALLLKYNRGWDFSAGAGPAAAVFASAASPDDEYSEYGARVAAELMRGSRAWASASYELGRRAYDAYDSGVTDIESIYSDYTYHRASLIALVGLREGLSLTTLLDYQPEDHEREGDDATATLFSVSLTYTF